MPDNIPIVLVVDIDPDTHIVSDGVLPDTECELVSARSADIALKLAERKPPSVLVISDRIAGIAYVCERIRRISPHLHIVLLTAQEQAPEALPHRGSGFGSTLRKPLDKARLRSTLRTVLRLSAMSAGVSRMHGAGGSEPGGRGRPTPLPWVGPWRENK